MRTSPLCPCHAMPKRKWFLFSVQMRPRFFLLFLCHDRSSISKRFDRIFTAQYLCWLMLMRTKQTKKNRIDRWICSSFSVRNRRCYTWIERRALGAMGVLILLLRAKVKVSILTENKAMPRIFQTRCRIIRAKLFFCNLFQRPRERANARNVSARGETTEFLISKVKIMNRLIFVLFFYVFQFI